MPTNYTFETYGSKGIVEKLDLTKIPRFDASRYDQRLLSPAFYPAGSKDQYGFNKDWGTTGFTVNTKQVSTPVTTWKEFFDRTQADLSGKVMIHDYQLTSIGSALVAFGYSFNSVDEAELAKAEELLVAVKPHLFAITSDYQPAMRSGDAWMTMTWTNDGVQLHRDIPEIEYVIAADGGEIWSDFFAVVTGAPHREAAYAFLDFMATPKVAATGRHLPRRPARRLCSDRAAAGGVDREQDHLSRPGLAHEARVRDRRAAHQPGTSGSLGTRQVRVTSGQRVVTRRAAGAVARAVTALLLAPTSAWYLLLLVVPLIILLVFSFGARAPEGGYAPALQLDNYLELPTRATAFFNTLWMAAGGTMLCLLVGYPLAYYLATRAGTKRTLLLVLVVVPFWTSFLIRTYAWMTILGNTGIPAIAEGLGVRAHRAHQHAARGDDRDRLQLPAADGLPALRQPRAARQAAAGGVQGPRCRAPGHLPPGDPPAQRSRPAQWRDARLHPDHGRVRHPGPARRRQGLLRGQRPRGPLPPVAQLALRVGRRDRPHPRHPPRGDPLPAAGIPSGQVQREVSIL